MAADLVNCPECHRQLRVPEELVGQQVKCPTCGHVFIANPEVSAPPPLRTESDAPAHHPKEEDDDQPSRRRSQFDDEDYDDEDYDRPSRRRSRYDDQDDDDYDRPRRRRDLKPHRGGGVLTLGILSLVICNFLGPIAWIMGSNDLTEIRAGRMDPEGEGMTNAGRICGIIGTVLLLLGCCGVILISMGPGGLR